MSLAERADFDPYDDYDDDAPRGRSPWLLLGAGVALGAVGALLYARQREEALPRFPDDAPGRAARGRSRFGDYAVVGRTVTIDKPRAELFDFWRDPANLPKFMEHLREAHALPDGAVRLVFAGPRGGDVEARIRIVEDRDGDLISWRSTEDSAVEAEGRVKLRDAPGGRGTQVEGIMAWIPRGGDLGRLAAGLFQKDPMIQGRRQLKRLKMLMETGEIADSRLNRAA
jgi:uncharacterized membrane protein